MHCVPQTQNNLYICAVLMLIVKLLLTGTLQNPVQVYHESDEKFI